MANLNYTQVQCFIYLVSFILSLTFFIPMVLNVNDFNGKCLLFTTGVFNESDGRIFEPNWASFSYCGFALFNGLFSTLASLIQLIRTIKLMFKNLRGSIVSTFWDGLIAFIAVVITLINSILVTIGFQKWCNSLSQNFESCEDAADSNVMNISNSDINPERFYVEFETVQFGMWPTLCTWVVLFVISSLIFYEHHQKENLIISMARERKRYEVIEEE